MSVNSNHKGRENISATNKDDLFVFDCLIQEND